MFEDFNFGKNIKNKYIGFNIIKEKSLSQQLDELKEDLIQITYNNGYLIDVGWYPEFSNDGKFKITVIKDYDWEKPVVNMFCKELNDLEIILKKVVAKYS